MYIKNGLTTWARNVAKSTQKRELTKIIAWWFGQSVKLSKDTPATPPGQSFEIWGKDAAKEHGQALKAAMEG